MGTTTSSTRPTTAASSSYLPVRMDWLERQVEATLEPGLPIIDPHHHLWERPDWVYMLDDLLADINTGHNIVATVFVQCRSMHRAGGPEEFRPVGETEFVNGVAAMSASGGYGPAKICAGIVGYADLRLGARVQEVLEAHLRAGGGRFRGIRHITAYDADPSLMNPAYAPPPGLLADATFREGFPDWRRSDLSFDAWLYHPQIDELTALARSSPDTRIVLEPCRRAARHRRLCGQARRGVFRLGRVDPRAGAMPQRVRQARRAWECGSTATISTSRPIRRRRRRWPPRGSRMSTPASRRSAPARCMFESNFPVDKGSYGYGVFWNACKRLASGASASEKADLFAARRRGSIGSRCRLRGRPTDRPSPRGRGRRKALCHAAKRVGMTGSTSGGGRYQ